MNLKKHIFQDQVMPTAGCFLQFTDMSWKDPSNFGEILTSEKQNTVFSMPFWSSGFHTDLLQYTSAFCPGFVIHR